MHCLFHSSSDDPETCLLEGETTSCDTYKCFQTVGKRCSVEHDAKLTGYVCAKSLFCGELKPNQKNIKISTHFPNIQVVIANAMDA